MLGLPALTLKNESDVSSGLLFEVQPETSNFKLETLSWSRGRVARLSSAKAPTAVRIRSRPLKTSDIVYIRGFLFSSVTSSVTKIFFSKVFRGIETSK